MERTCTDKNNCEKPKVFPETKKICKDTIITMFSDSEKNKIFSSDGIAYIKIQKYVNVTNASMDISRYQND